jgi:hypothetical protein
MFPPCLDYLPPKSSLL